MKNQLSIRGGQIMIIDLYSTFWIGPISLHQKSDKVDYKGR